MSVQQYLTFPNLRDHGTYKGLPNLFASILECIVEELQEEFQRPVVDVSPLIQITKELLHDAVLNDKDHANLQGVAVTKAGRHIRMIAQIVYAADPMYRRVASELIKIHLRLLECVPHRHIPTVENLVFSGHMRARHIPIEERAEYDPEDLNLTNLRCISEEDRSPSPGSPGPSSAS